MLGALEHDCVRAGSVGAALREAGRGNFDVLLTDIDLPDGNGWDVLAALAQRGHLPPRVITMSASAPEELVGRSAACGCESHLEKPFLLDDLEQVLAVQPDNVAALPPR